MHPEISEFSYGYALTSELIDRFKLVGAPIFPTQLQESKPGGGYDMKLPGVPIFIQFKRSDVLTTKNALDSSELGIPYHRYHLRSKRHSPQHDLLIDLEARGNVVAYAAPKFDSGIELDSKYQAKTIIEHSVFIKPSTIGRFTDNDEHSISFGKGPKVIFRSDPKAINTFDLVAEIEQLSGSTDLDKNRAVGTRRTLADQMLDIYAERTRDVTRAEGIRGASSEPSNRDYLSYISRNLFGSEILFVSK